MKKPILFIVSDRERPICKRADCNIVENPTHWVDVEPGPFFKDILDHLETLAYYLGETHEQDQLSEGHEDDCSYCKAIKQAENLIKQGKSKS